MDSYLYFIYTLIYIGILIFSLNQKKIDSYFSRRSFIYLVIVGLIVDNAIVAIGRFIGEGALLENLNYLRYWSHAFLTPTLVLYCIGALEGSKYISIRKTALYGATLITVLLIAVEVQTELINLMLQPQWEFGVLRYVPIETSSGPPIMILIVTLILLLTGMLLWIFDKWVWLLVGASLMTIGSIVSFPIDSGAITNGFEVILIIFLMLTKQHLERDLYT
ncbi:MULTISPECIES: hypothetical protein [Oceanobacillus]|uniref:hypothetical protein n=1 Tax=Oceanobacillus TaxID=182709 RepID=UPI001BE7396B|nr:MULTISPECIES: hypothetical protein [Oceanobacillus]MBT2600087.1 hypothetical protein [Oceanobacillus sp. ISL-74]MBT2650245.1 hypothetical protein [Oceanobacillus sp. ISL-73]